MENTTNNQFFVTGLFKDRDSAECAYKEISDRGYRENDSDIMMSDETRDLYFSGETAEDTEFGSKALEGSGTGAAIGGTLGAIVGAIAAIGTSVLLPGLGLIVAGPLAGALVGAGAGGITGGLVGALIGSGIPEEHAKAYETGIKAGGIFLRANLHTADEASYMKDKWEACGGEQVYTNVGSQPAATGAVKNTNTVDTVNTDSKGVIIPVVEEELHVGKREVSTGGVRVENKIVEKPVEKTVHLREEDVNVERRDVDRPVSAEDISNVKVGDFVITEKAEVPVVAKEARVVEEVIINKEVNERDKTVSDNIRKTDVDVEELADNIEKKKSNTAG